jgi:hypothetical protein
LQCKPKGTRVSLPGSSRTIEVARHVIGYRVWRVSRDRDGYYSLTSTNSGKYRWKSGVNDARCNEYPHDAPHHQCCCGLYAVYEPPWDSVPLGAIAAWGRIEAHRTGFRAQYAMPIVLAEPAVCSLEAIDLVSGIGRRYGVRVVPPDELEEWALQYGDPVHEGLRGDADWGGVVSPRMRRPYSERTPTEPPPPL